MGPFVTCHLPIKKSFENILPHPITGLCWDGNLTYLQDLVQLKLPLPSIASIKAALFESPFLDLQLPLPSIDFLYPKPRGCFLCLLFFNIFSVLIQTRYRSFFHLGWGLSRSWSYLKDYLPVSNRLFFSLIQEALALLSVIEEIVSAFSAFYSFSSIQKFLNV